jgi:hypothetical protein
MDDEKEIKKRTSDDNPDGERIKHALLENTIQKVVKKLIETGMTGNTIIFDQETCFLLESCNKEEQYFYQLKKIENNETVARTNHGILIPWAGYQKGINSSQTKSRESSDARLKQAEEVLKTAKTPVDLIDGLAQTPNKDPQMNSLRTTSGDKKMRTTAQEMIIPYEHTFYLRPIQSKLDIDFWKINQSKTDLWLEILSNRTLNHPEKKEHDQFTKYYSDYKDII